MSISLSGSSSQTFDGGTRVSLQIGDGGVGTGLIDGGTVVTYTSDNFDNIEVGIGSAGDGDLTITGSSTVVSTSGLDSTVQVGLGGLGDLTVSGGATLNTRQFEAGRGGQGEIMITGSGSSVVVGPASGPATESESGGFVRAGRDRNSTNGSSGELTNEGDGVIKILNGGLLRIEDDASTVNAGLQIGADGGDGEVVVNGSGSRLEIHAVNENVGVDEGGYLTVGRSPDDSEAGQPIDRGTNLLQVKNGGVLEMSGSRGAFFVARDGADGDVEITNGGQVRMTGDSAQESILRIGRDAGSTGTVTVEGAGSLFLVEDALFAEIGDSGDGTLSILDGGKVRFDGGLSEERDEPVLVKVGSELGSTGLLNLNGSGSILELLGGDDTTSGLGTGAFLQIGDEGAGEMTVAAGADVLIDSALQDGSFPGLSLGHRSTGEGELTVTGDGSVIDVFGDSASSSGFFAQSGVFFVGREGTGVATISDGASIVMHGADAVTIVGREVGSSGDLTVTGGLSRLEAGSFFLIGADFDFDLNDPQADPAQGGDGAVTISSLGKIIADETIIGTSGTLDGDQGTLESNVSLQGGRIDPGASVGVMTIDGDFTLESGRVTFEFEGFGAEQADQLFVTGDADLDRGQSVKFDVSNLSSVSDGDSFEFLTVDGELNWDLNEIQLFEFENKFGGFDFEVIQVNDDAILRVNETGTSKDVIAGTGDRDKLIGFTGDDVIEAGLARDYLEGGDGKDKLRAGNGNDEAVGGRGKDALLGGGGLDTLSGGQGGDFFDGGNGDDTLTGNGGKDRFKASAGTDTVTDFEDGIDRIRVTETEFNNRVVTSVGAGGADTQI
ncbi:MAG: hypothetical protein AAFW46_13410, partial [Pseudomonadota bacterium]